MKPKIEETCGMFLGFRQTSEKNNLPTEVRGKLTSVKVEWEKDDFHWDAFAGITKGKFAFS